MNTVNVLVLSHIGKECLRQIEAVSPLLRVKDSSKLKGRSFSKSGVEDPAAERELTEWLAEADIIYGSGIPSDILTRAPGVKWVQTMSAGVDDVLSREMINSPVVLTNTSGIHGVQITELVFGMILSFAKHIPQCLRNQENKKWEPYSPDLLHGKTLGVVGLGSIGHSIARMGKSFGMRVVATRRSIKEHPLARYVDTILPKEQLDQLLSESDYIILSLPHTAETEKSIGEKELRRMKPTAFLVNMSRGKVVDEEALIRALQEKWIAGAGLDTFVEEPLPPGSPLWKLPNVILTPHIAGRTDDYALKATAVFCNNLKRYLRGTKLVNVVNKQRGY
jgi:D-2-hydroxyacid dehydrogenase (NADP+)